MVYGVRADMYGEDSYDVGLAISTVGLVFTMDNIYT